MQVCLLWIMLIVKYNSNGLSIWVDINVFTFACLLYKLRIILNDAHKAILYTKLQSSSYRFIRRFSEIVFFRFLYIQSCSETNVYVK